MNGEPKLMKMPSYLKKTLKDGMIKESKSMSSRMEIYVLLYNSHFRFFVGKLFSKWESPYVIEEVHRSGAIKINNVEGTNPKVVNGQRIKHSGTILCKKPMLSQVCPLMLKAILSKL